MIIGLVTPSWGYGAVGDSPVILKISQNRMTKFFSSNEKSTKNFHFPRGIRGNVVVTGNNTDVAIYNVHNGFKWLHNLTVKVDMADSCGKEGKKSEQEKD